MPGMKKDPEQMTRAERKAYEQQKRLKKAILIAVAALVVVVGALTAVALTSQKGAAPAPVPAEPVPGINENADYAREDDPIATITMKDGGVITVRLYPQAAPNTVANFVTLANSGFYDGLIFHRVIPGFMIQGGDPEGSGTGGPGYRIKGEFSQNGVPNQLTHTRGVISMARSNSFDSAGSQFFIMHGSADYLDGSYAAFGEVQDGMDVVDRIASVLTNDNDRPFEDQVIDQIRVDTMGVEYNVQKLD